MMTTDFKPKIIAFLCNWCSYEGADSAGRSKREYPSNLSIVRVMCSGRVNPQFVVQAFRDGADGVVILGCHPGDCHYKEGNFKTLRRSFFLKKMLNDFGIEGERLHLDWISATEGEKFVRVISEMNERIKKLGPLSFDGGKK
ncbi:MAG: hydrogenase iron-sulfur subunit [Pseudomonadota bacterium]